jgi:AraC-like DNA-binding protein
MLEASMLGRIRQPFGWKNTGRHAPANLLIIITEGSIVFHASENVLRLTEGDCILLPEGTFYTASCKEEACEYIFIHFKTAREIQSVSEEDAAELSQQLINNQGRFKGDYPYSLPPTVYEGVFLHQKTILGTRKDSVMLLISKCEGYRYETSLNTKLRIDLHIMELLLQLSIDNFEGITTQAAIPAALFKIVNYIQQNYTRCLTLQELSDAFQLSKQYIIRMFHQHLGCTVTQHINSLKLYHSLELLKYSTLKVGQVSEALGFSNTYYFCRLFKRQYHLTPSEYIKSEMETKKPL